jgi:hypothetical protein
VVRVRTVHPADRRPGLPDCPGQAANQPNSADQLAKLADLRDRGVITSEEFDREKAKVLAA